MHTASAPRCLAVGPDDLCWLLPVAGVCCFHLRSSVILPFSALCGRDSLELAASCQACADARHDAIALVCSRLIDLERKQVAPS